METMNKNTVLMVTGNKAFEDNTNKFAHNFDSSKMIRNGILTVPEKNDKAPFSGLLMYSKRPSEVKYNYYNDDTQRLYLYCPNKNYAGRIRTTFSEIEYEDLHIKNTASGVYSNIVSLNYMGQFDTSYDLKSPDKVHILNLTSTISSLLGVSIPYSNIGSIIPHSYIFEKHEYCLPFYKSMVLKHYNNLMQIITYREKYYHIHSSNKQVAVVDDVEDAEQEELAQITKINTNMAKTRDSYNKYYELEIKVATYYNELEMLEKSSKRVLDEVEGDAKNETMNDDTTIAGDSSTGDSVTDDKKEATEFDSSKKVESPEPTKNEINTLFENIREYEHLLTFIHDYTKELSVDIIEDQKKVDITRFEIAIVVLLLLISILSIRVFAFIFEDTENYKRLPTVAKLEREDNERRPNKLRNLYVASNIQILIFLLLTA
jgi:hypothetical protein